MLPGFMNILFRIRFNRESRLTSGTLLARSDLNAELWTDRFLIIKKSWRFLAGGWYSWEVDSVDGNILRAGCTCSCRSLNARSSTPSSSWSCWLSWRRWSQRGERYFWIWVDVSSIRFSIDLGGCWCLSTTQWWKRVRRSCKIVSSQSSLATAADLQVRDDAKIRDEQN